MKKMLLIIVMFSFVAFSGDTWLSGGYVIKTGMRMYEVKEKCGDPFLKEKVGEIFNPSGASVTKTYIYEWIYKTSGFPRILTFHGSRLVRIETEDKF